MIIFKSAVFLFILLNLFWLLECENPQRLTKSDGVQAKPENKNLSSTDGVVQIVRKQSVIRTPTICTGNQKLTADGTCADVLDL